MKPLIALLMVVTLPVSAALDTTGSVINETHFLLEPAQAEIKKKSILEIIEIGETKINIKSQPLPAPKLAIKQSRFEFIPSDNYPMPGFEFYNHNEAFQVERFRTPTLRFKF